MTYPVTATNQWPAQQVATHFTDGLKPFLTIYYMDKFENSEKTFLPLTPAQFNALTPKERSEQMLKS